MNLSFFITIWKQAGLAQVETTMYMYLTISAGCDTELLASFIIFFFAFTKLLCNILQHWNNIAYRKTLWQVCTKSISVMFFMYLSISWHNNTSCSCKLGRLVVNHQMTHLQESAVHQLKTLDILINMAKKKGRRESIIAVGELFDV